MTSDDRLLPVLKQFARVLTGPFDLAELLYELGDHIALVLDADSAGISLCRDDDELRFVTASDEATAELEALQQRTQEGPCHDAYRSGQPVLVEDLRHRREWPLFSAEADRIGLVAVAGIPIGVKGGEIVGVINVYSNQPRTWSKADLEAATVLADIAIAYVIHSSELDKMRRVNGQLQAALESRIVIEQAKGILAGERKITVDDAFEVLRRHARSHRLPLRSVAEAVVNLDLRP